MAEELRPSARRVQEALSALGLSYDVRELPASTRTAPEAATAVGCPLEQIVKSLVFRRKAGQQPLLVIASGANRVNERRLAELAGEPVERADADYVRQRTGFAIGGVPPLGHSEPVETLIDQDLMRFAEVWAAAGTPNALFRLAPADLPVMTNGQVVQIT